MVPGDSCAGAGAAPIRSARTIVDPRQRIISVTLANFAINLADDDGRARQLGSFPKQFTVCQ